MADCQTFCIRLYICMQYALASGRKQNMPSHERRAAARQGLREMPEARPWFDAEKRARRAAGLQPVDSDVEEQFCP